MTISRTMRGKQQCLPRLCVRYVTLPLSLLLPLSHHLFIAHLPLLYRCSHVQGRLVKGGTGIVALTACHGKGFEGMVSMNGELLDLKLVDQNRWRLSDLHEVGKVLSSCGHEDPLSEARAVLRRSANSTIHRRDRARRNSQFRFIEVRMVHDSSRRTALGVQAALDDGNMLLNMFDALYQANLEFSPSPRFFMQSQEVWLADEISMPTPLDSGPLLSGFGTWHSENRGGEDVSLLITNRGVYCSAVPIQIPAQLSHLLTNQT